MLCDGAFKYKNQSINYKIMYTEKLKQEKNDLSNSNFRVNMAFEQLNRVPSVNFDRPTTEEHEKRKAEIADNTANELIANLSPEDRLDVFNNIRSRLENALKLQVEDMAYRLESETKYFENLKNIIY